MCCVVWLGVRAFVVRATHTEFRRKSKSALNHRTKHEQLLQLPEMGSPFAPLGLVNQKAYSKEISAKYL